MVPVTANVIIIPLGVLTRKVVNTLSGCEATDAGVVSMVIVPMDPALIGC